MDHTCGNFGGSMGCEKCWAEIIAERDDLAIKLEKTVTALTKHVCVRAGQGAGMGQVDYYPVDEDECLLCEALRKAHE